MPLYRHLWLLALWLTLGLGLGTFDGAAQTNVISIPLADFGLNPEAGVSMTVQLTGPFPRIVSGTGVDPSAQPHTTDATGTTYWTNLVWGNYLCLVPGKPVRYSFAVQPNTLGAVNVFALTGYTNTPPAGWPYYPAWQVDAGLTNLLDIIAAIPAGGGGTNGGAPIAAGTGVTITPFGPTNVLSVGTNYDAGGAAATAQAAAIAASANALNLTNANTTNSFIALDVATRALIPATNGFVAANITNQVVQALASLASLAVTNTQTGVTLAGTFSGALGGQVTAGTGSSVPAQYLTGTVPYGVLPQYANTNGSSITDTNLGGFTAQGAASFIGNGGGLTNLPAASLVGTIPPAALAIGSNLLMLVMYTNLSPGWYFVTNTTTGLVSEFLGTNGFSGGGGNSFTGILPVTGIDGTIYLSLTNQGALVFSVSNAPQWMLTQRQGNLIPPIPTFYPVSPGVMGVDFMPNGTPADTYGVVWNDICAVDCMSNNPSPLPTLHLSAHTNFMEIGTVSYNSGNPKPLLITQGAGAGNGVMMAFCPNINNWIGVGTTNPTCQVTLTNASTAAGIQLAGGLNNSIDFITFGSFVNTVGGDIWHLKSSYSSGSAGGALFNPNTMCYMSGTDVTNGENHVLNATVPGAQYRWFAGGSAAANQIATLAPTGTFTTTNFTGNALTLLSIAVIPTNAIIGYTGTATNWTQWVSNGVPTHIATNVANGGFISTYP